MEYNELNELAWSKLPTELRERAVNILLENFGDPFFIEVSKLIWENGLNNWIPEFWHFGQGMEVRNILRQPEIGGPGIFDSELPPLPEYYGREISNWDDYYIQVLECAVGIRSLTD